MTKNELRNIYKQRRQELTVQQIDKWNDLILINFQKLPLPSLHYFHTFLASTKLIEVDTSNIIRYLRFKNPEITVAAPRIDIQKNRMEHFYFDENTPFTNNAFGIDEPAMGKAIRADEFNLVIVPLLAFDQRGFRVGYGKGYYDKFLSECKRDVIKVGLSFFSPVEEIEDINQFDIPLNYCVTPQRNFTF